MDQTSETEKALQRQKFEEIVEILLSAGYFRARISNLSSFDKVVGGLCWCITSSGEDVDVDILFQEIGNLIAEWEPKSLVVGLPTHPDGTAHEMTGKAKRFGNQLNGRFGLPVAWVDERYTSAVLEGDSQMRDNLDAHSAVLILEQFFAE